MRENQRRQPRRKVVWTIDVWEGSAWHRGTVLDFSGGGIRFISPCPFVHGQETTVRVRPDCGGEYELRLRVRWAGPGVLGQTRCGAVVEGYRAVAEGSLKELLEKRFARLWPAPSSAREAGDKAA